MAINPIPIPVTAVRISGSPRHLIGRMCGGAADYWALTKPEVNFLIAITTVAGFFLAAPSGLKHFPLLRLLEALLGTWLAASGTASLNQYIERTFDAQMRRTARRPLAAGRIAGMHALWFGILLSAAGIVCLAVFANGLSSMLVLLTSVTYLALYTPSKRATSLCVLIGALAGAMPPLIGWAAEAGGLSAEAWLLYGILFLWQFPHVMAIAWMYREDYTRSGYKVLPGSGTEAVRLLRLQCLLPATLLIAISAVAVLTENASWLSFLGTVGLGLAFFQAAAKLAIQHDKQAGRNLLHMSIIYLPLFFLLLVLAKAWHN